jgi:hypothetical protein
MNSATSRGRLHAALWRVQIFTKEDMFVDSSDSKHLLPSEMN